MYKGESAPERIVEQIVGTSVTEEYLPGMTQPAGTDHLGD